MHFGYFDGATAGSNPGDIGIGFCIYHGRNEVAIGAGPSAFGTNNEAEYLSLVWLLETAVELGIKDLRAFGDSQLIINQVSGKWSASEKFSDAMRQVEALSKQFHSISFEWIPREKNKRADALSKRGLALCERKLHIKSRAKLEVVQREIKDAAKSPAEKGRAVNSDFTIRVARKYAVIIGPGSKEFFIDLKTRRCSCGLQNCVHLQLIGFGHENELKSA